MSSLQYIAYRPYISCGQYLSCVIYTAIRKRRTMIEIRVNELLNGRSFYWLAKQTSISHTTLWRLKKGKALGINFDTLEKICLKLNCQPGDVLGIKNEKKLKKK